jgi:hypothetical protein
LTCTPERSRGPPLAAAFLLFLPPTDVHSRNRCALPFNRRHHASTNLLVRLSPPLLEARVKARRARPAGACRKINRIAEYSNRPHRIDPPRV